MHHSPTMLHLDTIISGGQTGADEAALRWAKSRGLRTAGYMPHGFRTENGPRLLFNLSEMPVGSGNRHRDIANVDISDAVLGFRYNILLTGRGTECTLTYAADGVYEQRSWAEGASYGAKPTYVVWDARLDDSAEKRLKRAKSIREWLERTGAKALMVSGPCASTLEGVGEVVHMVLEDVWSSQ